ALPPIDMTSITQVPIEAYSNNVGLYGAYSSFYIAPANGALAKPPSQPGDLAIESLSVPAAPLLLDHKATVTARLRAGDADVGAHLVAFYDGDPQQGGQVFELQRIAHIAANDTYVSRAFFRPRTCGEHTVVVVAAPE